ncbi:hypothetical protein LCGC14_0223930 [marine sediment metagenome]|uniref:Uncharacterized protein n=1 Tax=marine sediment metagenome TaxID=412755 RepID=A0A0F9UCB6_9ZZZZ
MEEQKFSVCNLAMDTVILKIAALKSKGVESILREIQMNDEDLTEGRIALELDDIYEYCVLKEPSDPDQPYMEKIVKAFMIELPNSDDYIKLYNWDI